MWERPTPRRLNSGDAPSSVVYLTTSSITKRARINNHENEANTARLSVCGAGVSWMYVSKLPFRLKFIDSFKPSDDHRERRFSALRVTHCVCVRACCRFVLYFSSVFICVWSSNDFGVIRLMFDGVGNKNNNERRIQIEKENERNSNLIVNYIVFNYQPSMSLYGGTLYIKSVINEIT